MARNSGGEQTGPKYLVPALDKGLDVLELLSKSAVSMSQTDIARDLGRNVSEIFRTLNALDRRGFIRRTEAGQYRLTLKLFELSRTHSPYEELLRVAVPVMRGLSDEVRETCHLSTLRGGEIVVLAQHESPKPVRLSVEVGSTHSPLTTTSGRILLAAMDERARMDFLSSYTDLASWPGPDRNAFLSRVRLVMRRGYEIARDERFIGGLDIGVLIGSSQSQTRAALIVAALRNDDGPDAEFVRKAVTRAADKIGKTLCVI